MQLRGDKEKSLISTQSPCLLDKSSLAWSAADQLPRLHSVEKKLSVDSISSTSSHGQEVDVLFKQRDLYSTNRNTEIPSRDFYSTNRNTEIPSRDLYSTNHSIGTTSRDHEVCLPPQNKLLPSVKNSRVPWNWRGAKLPTTPTAKRKSDSGELHVPPHSTAHLMQFSATLSRSSSASSHSSATIGSDFKGKLQNYLHRSSDTCFKKLPCGLVYGKSLRGKSLMRASRNSSVELCVRPV